jgi:hypothetical protein
MAPHQQADPRARGRRRRDELHPAQPMNNAERYELTVFTFGYIYDMAKLV